MIELRVQASTPPMTWSRFGKKTPPYSIALDGFLNCGPKLDLDAPRANYDHHHGVSRLETRATCAQVLMAVRNGLYETFKDEHGQPHAFAYVNDCDQDVCTAWTVLNNPIHSTNPHNVKLNRLVDTEDKLDSTAGAYPFDPNLDFLREIAWVYEPYTQFRLSGGLEQRSDAAFKSIIQDVESRILKYLFDKGDEIPLDLNYDIKSNFNDWVLVDEVGAQARIAMFHSGIKVFCSFKDIGNGRWKYAIGKMSEYFRFNMPRILKALQVAEGRQTDQWGGATTVIGSPRIFGSKQNPDEVTRIIKENK